MASRLEEALASTAEAMALYESELLQGNQQSCLHTHTHNHPERLLGDMRSCSCALLQGDCIHHCQSFVGNSFTLLL